MRTTANPVEHCQRLIERAQADLKSREEAGRDTGRARERLKTLQSLLAAHAIGRDAA